MTRLNDVALERITGGFSAWIALGIAATVVFICGVISGITNPSQCG
jgi:hypothetical protein